MRSQSLDSYHATALSDHEIEQLIALEWIGWKDLETFLDLYKGSIRPLFSVIPA